MKPLYFHKYAKAEAIKASEFYEKQQQNLGNRFVANLVSSFQQIQINPFMFPVANLTMRRCRIHHFPYNIIFRVNKKQIEIIAIMHERQRPNCWDKRIKSN